MLPRQGRLTRKADFGDAVRLGVRATRGAVVVHLLIQPQPRRLVDSLDQVSTRPARFGFVVSRAVGGAVVRNRVKRRLRDLSRPYGFSLPSDCRVVVRALPAAATRSYRGLSDDLASALRKAYARLPAPNGADESAEAS